MKTRLVIVLVTLGLLTTIGFLYAVPRSKLASSATQEKPCCSDERFGSIEGHIYDVNGQPVSEATIYAERTDAIMTMTYSTESDNEGKFLIKDLPQGTYMLISRKEKDGYPITSSSFHHKDPIPLPQVAVNAQQVTSNVIVQIGQKASKLVLHITNAKTNKPIKNAGITLRLASNPDSLYSKSMNQIGDNDFEILAPSAPFTIEVEAPGYETWTYTGDKIGKHASPIQIAKEQKKELTIALQPIK